MRGMLEGLELALIRMRPIDGWLTEAEATLLYRCAEHAGTLRPIAPIVEVGSYCGRSTVVLATAAREAGTVVLAIDPHEGDCGTGIRETPTLERFTANTTPYAPSIIPLVQPSESVEWAGQIAMLFVDAKHDYASVRADFEHFAPLLAPSARVAFHDYKQPNPAWGVTRFVDGLLADGWREIAQADHLIAIERA